jgi:hypothetical protein
MKNETQDPDQGGVGQATRSHLRRRRAGNQEQPPLLQQEARLPANQHPKEKEGHQIKDLIPATSPHKISHKVNTNYIKV